MISLDPQALAEASAEAMWQDDRASQAQGMAIEEVGPGRARLAMTVAEAQCNGHGMCHGGFIFTLADSAFAFACNSYNHRVVAQQAAITFIAPAFAGDRLVASAQEVTRFGRNGVYDVEVRKADGSLIACFRGHSRQVKGTHLPEPA